jgi:hypothetical protein
LFCAIRGAGGGGTAHIAGHLLQIMIGGHGMPTVLGRRSASGLVLMVVVLDGLHGVDI